MTESKRPLRVLLVEDNQGDAFLIKELLRDTGIDLNISVAEDGQKALDMLNRSNGVNDRSIDLVILDLNLPKVHGLEVLSYIKSMHGLKQIPVVVMTGSLNRDDEKKAKALGASEYVIKPASNGEFETLLGRMKGVLDDLSMSEPMDGCPSTPGMRERHEPFNDGDFRSASVHGGHFPEHYVSGPAPGDRPW